MVRALKDKLGKFGEMYACHYLVLHGMELIARNLRSGVGEIDLLMADGDCLVLCEVKTRRSSKHGGAIESLPATRIARLRHTADVALSQYSTYTNVRVDACLVDVESRPITVHHFKDVQ